MKLVAAWLALFLAGCATTVRAVAELCEIEISIVHSPHLMQFTQSFGSTGESVFKCTLSTQGVDLARPALQSILEPECRRFMAEAAAAATSCSEVRFYPRPEAIRLEVLEGTDFNGPFFALRGNSQRHAPQQFVYGLLPQVNRFGFDQFVKAGLAHKPTAPLSTTAPSRHWRHCDSAHRSQKDPAVSTR